MKFTKFVYVTLTLYCCSNGSAESISISNQKPLNVGDRVPDIAFNHMVNYQKKTAKISDFQDKLLILDFWTTWCGPCIADFPRLDSLQRKFSAQIQILPVTGEKPEKIETFFERLKKKKQIILPSAADTDLTEYFMADGDLWLGKVWINKGTIIAYTEKEAVTEKNIQDVLLGKPLDKGLQKVIHKVLPVDFSKSLLEGNTLYSARTANYYSAVTTHIEGLEPMAHIKLSNAESKYAGMRLVNVSLSHLYWQAYELHPFHQIKLEMADFKHFDPPKNKKSSSNLYCYELIKESAGIEELREIMRKDLNKAFGYNVSIKKREVSCVILKKFNEKSLSDGGDVYAEITNFYVNLRNAPFSTFTSKLTYFMVNKEIPFVIDETGIKGNVDIVFDADLSNPQAVAKELKKYGLVLKAEKRKMEMLVIDDKTNE